MVLTQRLHSFKANNANLVSIPLWFLRNLSAREIPYILSTFPYHYGSYATGMVKQISVWL